jgi:hypothetical protein
MVGGFRDRLTSLPGGDSSKLGKSFATSGLMVGMQAITMGMLISRVNQRAIGAPSHGGSCSSVEKLR